ncbi:MAG: tyrosine-type recombinase/integrase [Dehalococcoidales bacterium]
MGSEGKRKIRLHRKTNGELCELYDAQLILRHRSKEALEEARRVLNHFREYLGETPPSPENAASFLAQFAGRKTTTLYRYHSIVKTFMEWYGEKIDTKIRVEQRLPDYIESGDIEKIKNAIRSRKSHKKLIERNLLIIDVGDKTGLRREEMSNLTVGDINLERGYLEVRQGKGGKDRIIDLTPSLQISLATFTKGKQKGEKVFGISPTNISYVVHWAARKAGVDIHTHSLRHFFGQSLVDTGTDLETVRRLMGHSSLRTTQVYIGRTDKQRREAINRLEQVPLNAISPEEEIKVPVRELLKDLRVDSDVAEKGKNGDQNVKRNQNEGGTHLDEFSLVSSDCNKAKAPEGVSSSEKNTAIASSATPEKSNTCLASPDDVRKETLKSWGIPARELPELIRVWCSKHRQGKHDSCKLFLRFRDDLVNEKIPFNEAKRMLEKGIFATERNLQTILQDLTQQRLFKPWENIQSEKAYFADFEERTKSKHDANLQQLMEIVDLLIILNDILRNSKSDLGYDAVLKVKKDPVYVRMIEHCDAVAAAFRKFEFDWGELKNLNSEKMPAGDELRSAGNINKNQLHICQKRVEGSAKILRKAVDDTLKNKWY